MHEAMKTEKGDGGTSNQDIKGLLTNLKNNQPLLEILPRGWKN